MSLESETSRLRLHNKSTETKAQLKSTTAIAPVPEKPPKPKKQQARKKKGVRAVGIGHHVGPPLLAQLRQRLADDPDAILTFAEWCGLNSLGLRTGRKIIASGKGPVITKLTDRRIGISRRHNRAWQEARARGAE
jgi:hypothetical protein